MADDDFNSVLGNVKQDAATQNAEPKPTTAPEPSSQDQPIAPALFKVLQGVRDRAENPAVPPSNPSLNEDAVMQSMQQKRYFSSQLRDTASTIDSNAFGRILDAFGHGERQSAAEAITPQKGATNEEMEPYRIKAEDDWKTAINKAVVGEAVEAAGKIHGTLNQAAAALSVPFTGGIEALHQFGAETGNPFYENLANTLSDPALIAITHQAHVGVDAIQDAVTKPPLPSEVYKAINNGIIEPTNPALKTEALQVTTSVRAAEDTQVANLQEKIKTDPQKADIYQAQIDKIMANRPQAPEAPAKAPNVHKLAAQIAPQAIAESRAAEAQQQVLRNGIENLKSERQKEAETNAPHTDEIAELQDSLEGKSKRQQKITQDKIDDLTAKNKSWTDEQTSGDTPEMQGLREGIQSLDEVRRNHAAEVSAAYRNAQEQMPQVIRESEPEIVKEQGTTRLYHGADESSLPINESRWFSSDIRYAKGYADKNPNGRILYVDLPSNHPLIEPEYPEQSIENGFHRNLELPEEIAKKARLLEEGKAWGVPTVSKEESIAAEAQMAELEKQHDALPTGSPEQQAIKDQMDALADKAVQRYAPERALEQQHAAIVNDIVKQATAKGYGEEEARASAELLARQYRYLADVYGGDKGNAEEFYNKEKPEIIGQGEKAKTLAQKVTSLFKPGDLSQSTKGKYHVLENGVRLIRLMKNADASTLIHEGAHHFMDMMKRFSAEEDAPKKLKDDMALIRRELGVKDRADLSTRQEERFARGFERYVMEGHAPTKGLIPLFQKFEKWLTSIYQSVKNIPNSEISPAIRDFFDRVIEPNAKLRDNPRSTVVTAEKPGETLAAIHEADARDTAPEHADNVRDTVESEIDHTAKLHDPEIADAIKDAEKTSDIAEPIEGDTGIEVAGEPAGEGGASGQSGEVANSGGDVGTEGSGTRAEPAAEPRGIGDVPTKSKSVDKLFDKAGNIRLENLTNEEETRAALREVAKKTGLLEHGPISDLQIAELAKSLGVKAKEINIERLRQLAIEDDIPLAARIRAGREMLIEADKNARELASKVEGGTSEDLANFSKAYDRFLMISETVSAITNQVGRGLRAFQDISGDGKASIEQLETLFQQEMGKTPYDMKDLARLVASKTVDGQAAQVMQRAAKPGFWNQFAEYRRCSILSGFVTHALWLAGTGVNLIYKPIVLDTLGGIHNEIGMALGRADTGSTVLGGIEGLSRAIMKSLPNILSATGTAARTGKTVLRPFEGEFDTYLATGGIRKTLNIDPIELKKATDSAFSVSDYPELKALQDRINQTADVDKKAALQSVLDAKSNAKKTEVAQVVASRMQSRLKTWGDLAGEMHDFGASAMASALSVGKNMASPRDFFKDKPLLEAKREEGQALPDIYAKGVPVLPVGTVMRGVSSRIYSTMHTFARETAASIESIQEARRVAVAEGKTGVDIETRKAELLADPTKAMMQRINHNANKQTLMSNESQFAKMATRFRNAIDHYTGTKIGSILMPVVGVPAEAVHQTVMESTPIGLLAKNERGELSGKMGALEQERAQVKMLAGTALMGTGLWLASKGLSTPSPSVNYKQEQERKDAGQQSGSIRAGDWMISLGHVPVTGTLITAGADMYHLINLYRGEDKSEAIKPAVMSAVNNMFLHENSLVELSNIIDLARGKDSVANYLKNFTSSTVIPQFIKQANDLSDPLMRDSKSLTSSLISKIPGESESLPPKINALTGEPIEREPLHAHTARDPIAENLMKINIYPTTPRPNINGVDLSPPQGAEYSSVKGHILHNGLQMLIEGDGKEDFDAADTDGKRKMVIRIESHAAQCAKSYMFNKYPELLRDANNKYESSCIAETQ